jgi:hypothetical protein
MSFERLMCYDVLEGAILPRLGLVDRVRLSHTSRALWRRLAGRTAQFLAAAVAVANAPQGSLGREPLGRQALRCCRTR